MQTFIIAFIMWIIGLLGTKLNGLGVDINGILSQVGTVSAFIHDLFNLVNFIIPIDTIFNCIKLMVMYYWLMFGLWLTLWIIRRVFDVIP